MSLALPDALPLFQSKWHAALKDDLDLFREAEKMAVTPALCLSCLPGRSAIREVLCVIYFHREGVRLPLWEISWTLDTQARVSR